MKKRALTPSGLPIYSELDFIKHAQAKDLPESVAVIKGFTAEVKAIKDTNRFNFTISTAGVDRDKDVISVNGWQLDNYKKNPVVLFAHDYHSLPVGKSVSIKTSKNGLGADVEFASADVYPFAETVKRMVAGGFLNAASVGFKPMKYAYNEERRGVDIMESELLEWSIVPVPANPECLVQLSATLEPGMLDEFAKSCESFMVACKGKGQWVVDADMQRLNDVVEDFVKMKDELIIELSPKKIAEVVMNELPMIMRTRGLPAEKSYPGCKRSGGCPTNENGSPDNCTMADCPMKSQGQVGAEAGEVDIKDLVFEDENDYIFGIDAATVTQTVREQTRSALKEMISTHIKTQIDYARGRIQD